MILTHNSLAVVSGIALIGIIVGVYITNANYTQKNMSEKQKDEIVNTVQNTDTKKDVPDADTLPPQTENILDLSGSDLEQVPNYVFQKKGIEKLDLSNNKLTGALQAEVRFLSQLTVLDLSDNMFTGVPAEIGQLINLEVLDLSNNKLTGLPNELGKLQNLKTLDIQGNDYAQTDLAYIRSQLPKSTNILID